MSVDQPLRQTQQHGVGYSLGRFISQNPLLAGGLAAGIAATVWGVGAISAAHDRQLEEDARALGRAAAAQAAARANEAAAKLQEKCTTGIAPILATARDRIKSGAPKLAIEALGQCEATATDPAVKATLQEARAAAAKADAAWEARFRADEAKAKAQELARRKKEGVAIGMTEAEVLQSSWGKPRKVNRTVTARSQREQWVYDGGYLYFEDGVLTAIQN